jgi:hypothetical protein
MESLEIVVVKSPPSEGVQVGKLLAVWVTTPSRQAAWAAAASALHKQDETVLGAARLFAAAFARQSTSLLARQSTVVRPWPLLSVATPTALCDLCAGIQTTLPELTMDARSSPTTCAILDQTLARGLSWCVALPLPARAVVSRAWQSVRMCGTNGQWERTTSIAHASAEAAVSHQEGGHPRP